MGHCSHGGQPGTAATRMMVGNRPEPRDDVSYQPAVPVSVVLTSSDHFVVFSSGNSIMDKSGACVFNVKWLVVNKQHSNRVKNK